MTDIAVHGWHLFIGTGGEGFFQVDTATGEQQHHLIGSAAEGLNIIWRFQSGEGDTLWIGTQRGLLYYTLNAGHSGRLPMAHPAVLDSVAITALLQDSRRRMWIGLGRAQGAALCDTGKRSFRVFPYRTGGYPFLYPLDAAEDPRGNIWFTNVATGTLAHWENDLERFRPVEMPGLKASAHYADGRFLLEGERGEIWYGLVPTGLMRYRITDGSSQLYAWKENLPHGRIYSIVNDRHGRLWLGNSQGISCFDPNSGLVINYTRSDGLAANTYTALHYDPVPNQISAGAPGFLTWFHPPEQLTDDRPMRIFLTGVEVNGTPLRLPDDESLRLGPDEGHITVKFAAINLASGGDNRYQYRLNNGPWEDLAQQPVIRFASIKSGVYLLEVRAARKLGRYGPAHRLLHFSVRPRFTSTLWFYLLSLGVVGLLVWAWYRYRLSTLRKLESVRAQISRDLHDEIGSRLTNINMMSQIIRHAPAAEQHDQGLLGKIQAESEEITRSMREIIWNIDPHNDRLAAAMPRMLTYASQLLEPMNIDLQASIGELDDIQLDMARRRDLLLIFKEAVHNIAKHSGATKVLISAEIRNGMFHLRIADNGKGYLAEAGTNGNGLRYMAWPAAAHQWNLCMQGTPGEGSRVSLKVPLQ